MEPIQICPFCNTTIAPASFFCPNCGKPLLEKPLTFSKKLTIYLISFFLPPFGLRYAFKYLKQNNPDAKFVGIIAILLTIISFTLSMYIVFAINNYIYGNFYNKLNGLGY